jgi:hypothetical protein
LLSMFLRPDFECLQQLANFILDRLMTRAILYWFSVNGKSCVAR